MTIVSDGELLAQQGRLAEATDHFIRALDRHPDDPEALNNLGVIAFEQGQKDTAISCFGRALTADPSHSQAAYNLCSLLATVPETEIEANNLYAWPFLLVRVSSPDWCEDDSRLLARLARVLTDDQREMLLRLLMQQLRPAIDIDIVILAESLIQMSADFARELGKWMANVPVPRHVKDRLEEAICRKCPNDSTARTIAHRASAYHPDGITLPAFQFYPRRIVSGISPADPFMKLVPRGAPAKTGLRVLVMGDHNIAGQLTALTRALNKYTDHAARCIIYREDYLNYDKDVLICTSDGVVSEGALSEAVDLVHSADFFHIGRELLDLPGIEWSRYISPRNAVFQYYGSELRDDSPAKADFHAKTGFPAISACDYTMYRLLPSSFYHIQPYMIDMDDLPQAAMDTKGKLRICHAPSSQNYRNIKRSDIIRDVMRRLAGENDRVEPVEIANVPNRQCLEIKSTCHIHIVSLLFTFGLNTIESAAMGLVPITPLDNFSMLLYPDTPVVHATPSTLYDVTRKLVAEPERLKDIGAACRQWAKREFDAGVLVQKYWYLYDLIYHGFSLDYPDTFGTHTRYTR